MLPAHEADEVFAHTSHTQLESVITSHAGASPLFLSPQVGDLLPAAQQKADCQGLCRASLWEV